ncbi:MAG: hypothetical protein WCT10_02065 [Patescibacteria group bacterium]|jgi:hypothetical protein
MFDDAKEPVDIFAEVDKPRPVQPAGSGVPAPQAAYSAGPNKLLLGLVGVIVLAAIGGGAYFFLNRSQAPAPAAPTDQAAATDVEAQPTQPEAQEPQPEPAAPQAPEPQPQEPIVPPAVETAPIDSDGDGLSDMEEAQLGTDPQAVDTDNDGLTDFEEVRQYKTDPKKPDTDGDGYLDGAEVKAGYNPLGPGKLPGLPPTP